MHQYVDQFSLKLSWRLAERHTTKAVRKIHRKSNKTKTEVIMSVPAALR